MIGADALFAGIARACARNGLGEPADLKRLTGGATMESWRFVCGQDAYVLRRAPSAEFMADRPYGHDVEAEVIRKAFAAGVTAPEVVAELTPEDAIGSGFVMRSLPGTPNPKEILEMQDASGLLRQAAGDLARIHGIARDALPDVIPVMDYREAIADFRAQFTEAGGDRPIIALGIKWLEENCPEACEPVLNHGDYRLGNLLAEDSKLTGVLDWELAHFGDPHEDLAFGCMAVWRFARYDRPALGLGSLEAYFAAYEAAGGAKVDPKRFRYWLVHRTVWWALGCLKMAKFWRSGEDRMLERVVISRRTSEQELDLLMLLEEDAPDKERHRKATGGSFESFGYGEADSAELADAILEWLETIKHRMEGHDRFQHAVARNALGIIARDWRIWPHPYRASGMVSDILDGKSGLKERYFLQSLKGNALEKVSVDSPKYPALAVARKKWTGET
ncbi:MAG: phosphotransferase family protein [Marinomonas sp.]